MSNCENMCIVRIVNAKMGNPKTLECEPFRDDDDNIKFNSNALASKCPTSEQKSMITKFNRFDCDSDRLRVTRNEKKKNKRTIDKWSHQVVARVLFKHKNVDKVQRNILHGNVNKKKTEKNYWIKANSIVRSPFTFTIFAK